VGFSLQRKTDFIVRFVLLVEMRGVVLAFRKAGVLISLYALLNASVIVANNSLDCLLFTLVQLPAT
jgi:hypothetical protein